MTVATEAKLICRDCGKTKELKRLPAGWKRRGEEVFCGACWGKKYLLRAITVPIAKCDDWNGLDQALKQMFVETTRCANWMSTQLYIRDIKREPEMPKLPPMPRIYLYPEARVLFPTLPPQTVSSLEQVTQRKYRARRYEVIWTNSASLSAYRYPQPFPVHNQSWEPYYEGQRAAVSVRIADRRWQLGLKQGPQFRRQLTAFGQMVSGVAVRGELALMRPPFGAEKKSLMCKMVAWLPREEQESKTGTLRVRTDKESLLVAFNEKDERLWVYHADHLRRWVTQYNTQRQRWSDDKKAEERPVPSFRQREASATLKQRNRLQSAVQQAAAYVTGYAHRRRFAKLVYDDSERSYCMIPWEQLRNRIQENCNEHGIEFASISMASEGGVTLAEE